MTHVVETFSIYEMSFMLWKVDQGLIRFYLYTKRMRYYQISSFFALELYASYDLWATAQNAHPCLFRMQVYMSFCAYFKLNSIMMVCLPLCYSINSSSTIENVSLHATSAKVFASYKQQPGKSIAFAISTQLRLIAKLWACITLRHTTLLQECKVRYTSSCSDESTTFTVFWQSTLVLPHIDPNIVFLM